MKKSTRKIQSLVEELRRELAIKAIEMGEATENFEKSADLRGKKKGKAFRDYPEFIAMQEVSEEIRPAIEFILETYVFAKEANDAQKVFLNSFTRKKKMKRKK